MSLYKISEELKALDQLMDEQGGDVSEGTEGEQILKWMEKYEWQEKEKIDAYGAYAKNLQSMSKACRDESKRLMDRARVLENRIDNLKRMAKEAMDNRGVKKIEGNTFTVSIQKNGGKMPVTMIEEDINKIPDGFIKIEKRVNLDAIGEALTNGDPLISGIAEFGERGESVRIR